MIFEKTYRCIRYSFAEWKNMRIFAVEISLYHFG